MLESIIAKVLQLRTLERNAKADIGTSRESEYAGITYFHHIPSPVYAVYEEGRNGLGRLIDGLPQPQGWLLLASWCDRENPVFGHVPDGQSENNSWDPQGWSLRSVLLDSMLRCLPSALNEGSRTRAMLDDYARELVRRRDLAPFERACAIELRAKFKSRLP